MTTYHSDRLKTLTEKAKRFDGKYDERYELGEKAYLICLSENIKAFRRKEITAEQLKDIQKELELQLEKYYIEQELYDYHISINNHCSEILTEAEKGGCPICKKLVRVFDGREKYL